MKKNIFIYVGSILLTIFLLSCSSQKKNVLEKQVLNWPTYSEPVTIDPGLVTENAGGQVSLQLFEGLTSLDPKTSEVIPGVATNWNVSQDGKRYIFYLRKNAKFSDGSLVTAHDFVYSWRRTLNPELASRYAFILYPLKGGKAYNIGETKEAATLGVKALDDFTLQVDLDYPTPYFPGLVAKYSYYPVKKTVVEKHGKRWTYPENIVGNGPFVLKQWDLQEKMVLAPNPYYWEAKKVRLKKVTMYFNEDIETNLKKYLSGTADAIYQIPVPKMPELKKRDDFYSNTIQATYQYEFNCKHPALKDKRVRQALSYSIDRESLTKLMLKEDIPAKHYTPDVYTGYKFQEMISFDVEKARKLLAEAGYPNGKNFPNLTLYYNTQEGHKQIAEIVQNMWKKYLKVNINIQNQEWKVLIKNRQSKSLDIVRMGWVADYNDPNTFLEVFTSWSTDNYTEWTNKEYDEWIKKGQQTIDQKKRFEYLAEAEKILMDEAPIIPIYHYRRSWLINPKVAGLYPNPADEHSFKYVSINE